MNSISAVPCGAEPRTNMDIALNEDEVGEAGSWIKKEKMSVPPIEKEIEIIKGSADVVSAKIAEIIKSKGLI